MIVHRNDLGHGAVVEGTSSGYNIPRESKKKERGPPQAEHAKSQKRGGVDRCER